MSRETVSEHDHDHCKHCGRGQDEHRLAVNPAGIVTAGIWISADTFTLCADAAVEATLRDLVVQITRLEYDAEVMQAQATVQARRVRELAAENADLRGMLATLAGPYGSVESTFITVV